MDLVKKFSIHLFGKKRRTTCDMSPGMEDIIREVGNGKIGHGLQKLALCGYLIKELDGISFDRGFRRLCRTLEIMQEPDHDGDAVQATKQAKEELDILEDEIRDQEAELSMKKFNHGLAKLQKSVSDL